MRIVALACLAVLAACQPSARDARAADVQSNGAGQSVAPATPGNAQQPVDPEKLLAENDGAIAENKRMIDALQAYAKADPDKLTRLRTGCQQKLGAPADRGGAARIFTCIRDSW